MNKKTVLFIHPFIPYPLKSGGHQALYNGIKAIKDEYNVLVAYEAFDSDGYRKTEEEFVKKMENVTVLPFFHKQKKFSFLQRICLKLCYWMELLFKIETANDKTESYNQWVKTISPLSGEWTAHLNNIFNSYKIDIVQVEMPWMVSAVFNIPDGIKKIFVHHELGFVRRDLEMKNLDDTSIARVYNNYTTTAEINILNNYDRIVTLSETDKVKLINAGVNKPIDVSFAIIDTESFSKNDKPFRKVLSFVGPQMHTPNVVGIDWFIKKCWPLLILKNDAYQLQIIGNWSEEFKSRTVATYPGINFLGYVDNLSDAIDGTIMIVPITIGSGIRMKILEAAASGVPVVSTSVGAEGLPMIDGVNCFLRDNPEEFVNAIIQLEDTQLRESMVSSAKSIVLNKYTFEALRNNRLSILSNE